MGRGGNGNFYIRSYILYNKAILGFHTFAAGLSPLVIGVTIALVALAVGFTSGSLLLAINFTIALEPWAFNQTTSRYFITLPDPVSGIVNKGVGLVAI